jgi:hypothetical protein
VPIEICGMLFPVMEVNVSTPARIGGAETAGGRARGVQLEAVDLFAHAPEESGFDTALMAVAERDRRASH